MADANVSVSFSASINDFVSGVGQAKDALQSFSAPFGEINAQLSSLATASSQAFNPSRLQPYRDALDATRGLQNPSRPTQAGPPQHCERATTRRTPTLRGPRNWRPRRSLDSLRTDSSRSSPSTPRRLASMRLLSRKRSSCLNRRSVRNTPPNSGPSKGKMRSGSSRLPQNNVLMTCSSKRPAAATTRWAP